MFVFGFTLEEYRQLSNFVEYGDVPFVQSTNAEHFFFLFLIFFLLVEDIRIIQNFLSIL